MNFSRKIPRSFRGRGEVGRGRGLLGYKGADFASLSLSSLIFQFPLIFPLSLSSSSQTPTPKSSFSHKFTQIHPCFHSFFHHNFLHTPFSSRLVYFSVVFREIRVL